MLPEWVYRIPFDIIRDIAQDFQIDSYLVAAIIMAESSGMQFSIRYEPKWSHFYTPEVYAQMLGVSEITERLGQSHSWGYMQVMGGVAREHGFSGHFPQLCDKKLNIYYGVKHFSDKLRKYKHVNDAIAAYNAGTVTKTEENMYSNQLYVDKVLGYYDALKEF
jgi:soluble lytic murein transglycosylase-like protein